MATHKLDNETDIRHIQEMPGYDGLGLMQLYTKLSELALKDVHTKTHLAAAKGEES